MIHNAKIKQDAFDFLGCEKILDHAIQLELKIGECSYSQTMALEIKESLQNAILFQNKLIHVNEKIENREFNEAIKIYYEAGLIFNTYSLSEYGLYYVAPFDFVEIKRKEALYIALAQNAVNKSEFEMALTTLTEIKARNITHTDLNRILEILGAKIALRDVSILPKANAKKLVKEYTNDDNWYQAFKEAYLLIWKTS